MSLSSGGKHKEPYLAGCWLRDIQRSLLWEQRYTGQRYLLSPRAPTWPWAASLDAVHWRKAQTKLQDACELTGVLSREECDYAADVSPLTYPTRVLAEQYNVDNYFAALVLPGRFELILQGGALDESEKERIARYTGVANEHTSRWTAISDPTNPKEHNGWADIESHSSAEGRSDDRDRQILLALHVCTEFGVEDGLQFGYAGATHDVYCVLFLNPLDGVEQGGITQYVRAGIGRVYKKDFFKRAEEVALTLV